MNTDKVEGVFDEAKGKVKQGVGEAFNDQSLANSGTADQVKGHAKEAWGDTKDAAYNATHGSAAHDAEVHTENTGHNVREGITHAAESVKDSIKHGIDKIEEKFKS